jgi:hypothetical protein
MTVPAEIMRLAGMGWKLFPRARRHRASCFKGAHDAATSSEGQLREWATQYPNCGWCVATGASRIWALDVDRPGPDHAGDGLALLSALVRQHGSLPARPMVRSGGGGLLLVFAYNGEPINGRSGALGPGIDPKRGRHSITMPPTLHHRTGAAYRWIHAPWHVPPPDAPDWLLRLLEPPAERACPYEPPASSEQAMRVLYRACDRIGLAPQGGRNDTLNRAAWPVAKAVATGRLPERDAEAVLIEAARRIGLPYTEAASTVRGAFRAARRSA